VANKYLQQVIETKDHLRPFEFEMSNDPGWEHANPYFKNAGA
jgi:hypothetical protein